MQFRRLLKAVPAAFVIAAFPRFAAALPEPASMAEPPGLLAQGLRPAADGDRSGDAPLRG